MFHEISINPSFVSPTTERPLLKNPSECGLEGGLWHIPKSYRENMFGLQLDLCAMDGKVVSVPSVSFLHSISSMKAYTSHL